MSLRDHWDAIFAGKPEAELGWYERDVSQTWKFLDRIPSLESAVVFLPGAGTSRLVDALLRKGCRLVLNDISDEALKRLGQRLGDSERIIWLRHDISRPLPDGVPAIDVWIDRAVLHFLLHESEIDGYFTNLRSVLRPGGHALMAQFSLAGAEKCAGLPLHRYSVEELCQRMGGEFDLLASEDYTFVNPSGDSRPYVYALFRRKESRGGIE